MPAATPQTLPLGTAAEASKLVSFLFVRGLARFTFFLTLAVLFQRRLTVTILLARTAASSSASASALAGGKCLGHDCSRLLSLAACRWLAVQV